ncbi:lysozyme [Rickettsia endosymbiont of Orchestes rusci]|uniref:lysozyme n=1 Tax=Rickettsia endosymbiont of Orchestes rusci TaxID=3066250 RepID=UPI00313E5E42
MSAQELAKQLIKQFESLRLAPYYCPAGRKTIGYGHAIKPHELPYLDTEITKEQAERLLDEDVKQVQIALHKYCHVYLSVNQQVALISFIFNCGAGAFKASTLRRKLNKGQYSAAADEFLKWVYAGDKKLTGLVKRRTIERAVFLGEVDLSLIKF